MFNGDRASVRNGETLKMERKQNRENGKFCYVYFTRIFFYFFLMQSCQKNEQELDELRMSHFQDTLLSEKAN